LEVRFVPRFRRAVRGAVVAAREAMKDGALRAALSRGDVSAAVNAVALDAFASTLRPAFERVFLMAMAASGRTERLPLRKARPPMGSTTRTPAAVTGRLDLTNPRAIAAAQRYSYDLVTDITTQTRAAIRRTIVAGQRGQLTVDQQADRIRRAIGLNEQQAVAVMNLDMGLREDGDLTEEQITARVARAVEDGLDYRAEMIARTESIRAAAAGQQELFYQAAENGMLGVDAQRAWVASPDACGLCLELDGVEVGLNEPWEADGEELMLPPAHPMCRCTIAITDPGSYAPGSETLDEE
jgi:hypothetical protein